MPRVVAFKIRNYGDVRVGIEMPATSSVLDVNTVLGNPTLTVKQFITMGQVGIDQALAGASMPGAQIPASDVTLHVPMRDPEKVICIGMNYTDHCTEQGFPIPKEPVVFSKFASAIIDLGEDIVLDETQELDFEVELVIVVGKKARKVEVKDAMDYVYGYTVAHDVSARDWQLKRNGGQWLIGKTMDSFLPYGPAIVTKDEVGDAHALNISCTLNGTKVQNSNTAQLIFKTEDIIAFCSRFFTLNPGDIICTGTPPGVGAFRKPPLWLKAGDVVTCEIEKLGSITNTVVSGKS